MKNDKNKGCDLPQERNTMDYLDEIKEAWENTDSYTKEANNYDIQHYVEYGGYESDAFARWWEEGLSDTHYLASHFLIISSHFIVFPQFFTFYSF